MRKDQEPLLVPFLDDREPLVRVDAEGLRDVRAEEDVPRERLLDQALRGDRAFEEVEDVAFAFLSVPPRVEVAASDGGPERVRIETGELRELRADRSGDRDLRAIALAIRISLILSEA